MFEVPTAQGLTVCELYIVDDKSKNVTLVNQFTTLKSDAFPTAPKKFALYAVLSDGSGEMPMRVEVVELVAAETVWQTVNRLRIPDRLTAVRYAVTLAGGCRLSRTRRVRSRVVRRG